MASAEGPLWWKEGGYLLLSDINGNRRMKYTPGQGTVEFKKPTNGANGSLETSRDALSLARAPDGG
jgi:gluconolactonase